MTWGVATPPPTSGVNDAVTTGARGGIAATVGGSADGAVAVGAGAVAAAVFAGAGVLAGAAADVEAPVISRTTWAARSDSRRLRSSETLSVGVCRDFRACLG